MIQATIQTSASINGVGLHSGEPVTLTVKPAPDNTGIVFIRTDQEGATVKACPDNLFSQQRATLLSENNCQILTPEHILSACQGLQIHNLFIEVSSHELPILDGSAKPFVDLLIKAQRVSGQEPLDPFIITEPICVESKNSRIIGLPSSESVFSFVLNAPTPYCKVQSVSHHVELVSDYIHHTAPARTWTLEKDIESLRNQGLIKGGSLDNALVLGATDYINRPRLDNEISQHKLLDLMGDCLTLGRPIQGHIIGIYSGHDLAMQFVKKCALLMN